MLRFFSLVLIFSIFSLAILQPSYANPSNPFLQRNEVQDFIDMMVKDYHFNRANLNAIFSAVKVRPQVMRQLSKPLEKETWRTYQMLFVNEWRIEHGLKFWNKYKDALAAAEQKYGVPASIIVATIGIETKYGERIGDHRVMDALCNIAFSNSPRASYFKKELIQFLLLSREQHFDPLKINGSYAGAIGQPQFMPSSYRHYAVDFSQDGKIDLVHDEIDVIGSVANYYQKNGWKKDLPIAMPALSTTSRYAYFLRQHSAKKNFYLHELEQYDIVPKNADFSEKMKDQLKVRIIPLSSGLHTEYWLGFHNFSVIKRYNSSDLYAMAVYQLSYYITSLKDKSLNG